MTDAAANRPPLSITSSEVYLIAFLHTLLSPQLPGYAEGGIIGLGFFSEI